MQDLGYGLLRIAIPRTWVHKGREKRPRLLRPGLLLPPRFGSSSENKLTSYPWHLVKDSIFSIFTVGSSPSTTSMM
jgi:hypothetical protein